MKRALVAALTLCALVAPVCADELRRLPPPQAVDPRAAELDIELDRIVAARDVEALAEMAIPEVKLSFGGDYGRERLRAWAREDWFWDEWRRIAAHPPVLRGAGEGAYLAYPWYFAAWPDDLDPFELLIGEQGAALLDRPFADAAVLADLSFAILPADVEDAAPDGWRRLCVRDNGPCGFVEERVLASPIGWRAVFHLIDGRWRLTAFVAGD